MYYLIPLTFVCVIFLFVMHSFYSPSTAASSARASTLVPPPARGQSAHAGARWSRPTPAPYRRPMWQSDSEKAGLQWPVGHVRKNIRRRLIERGATALTTSKVGRGAPVYLAAVLEYISAEILELANNEATKNCQGESPHDALIEVPHVEAAIAKDDEICKLFSAFRAPPSPPPRVDDAEALANALRVGEVAANALIASCARSPFKPTVAPLTALPLAGSSDVFNHGYTDSTETQDLLDLLSALNPTEHVFKTDIEVAIKAIKHVIEAEAAYVEAVCAHTKEAESKWHEMRKGHVGPENATKPPESKPAKCIDQAYARTLWRRRRVAVVVPSAVRAYHNAAIDAGYRVLRKAYAAEKKPDEVETQEETFQEEATTIATATVPTARIITGPHSTFRMSDAASRLMRAVKTNA